jgi:hypothetical protein
MNDAGKLLIRKLSLNHFLTALFVSQPYRVITQLRRENPPIRSLSGRPYKPEQGIPDPTQLPGPSVSMSGVLVSEAV